MADWTDVAASIIVMLVASAIFAFACTRAKAGE
jgi:hypothetical protein